MKRSFYLLVFILIFTSCKKERSFSERYESEAYELLNQQFLPYIDTVNIQYHRKQIFERKVYLTPYEYHSEKHEHYLSHLIESKIFTIDEVNLNQENKLQFWNKNKLLNTKIIDSTNFKRVDSIRKLEFDSRYDYEDPISENRSKELFDLGIEFFEKDIEEPLFTISSPFFDKEFKKAVYYFNIREPFIGCGGFSDYQYFEKHKGVWKQVTKNEQ